MTDRQYDNERLLSPPGVGLEQSGLDQSDAIPLCIFGPGGDFRWGYTPQLPAPPKACPGRAETRGSAGGGGGT